MTDIACHGARATKDSTPFASMKGTMEGMIISLSEHKPRTYKHADDADARKEHRRARHAESDGTQSLTMRRSVSGSGLSLSLSRRHSRWPVDSNTIRRSHTFDGEVVGGHDSKTTLSLRASSSHGSVKHGSRAASSVTKTASNPSLMKAIEKESKSKSSKSSKSKSSKSSKSKNKVAESCCDYSKTNIPGKSLTGSNSSPSLNALSSVGLKVANANLVSSSLLDHANLILRQSKTDRLASINPTDGDQSTVQPRTQSCLDETAVARCLFPVLMVENRIVSKQVGNDSFSSFLLEDALNN
jgi:hypothetical protein